MMQPGLCGLVNRFSALSKAGDPLERFKGLIDSKIFRQSPLRALLRSDGRNKDHPPFDPVLMVKGLLLQGLYSLSDKGAEFQIRDRLKQAGVVDDLGAVGDLFAGFKKAPRAGGTLAMRGQSVKTSLVQASKQRNTKDESESLKEGRTPEEWRGELTKRRQKNRDARQTMKVDDLLFPSSGGLFCVMALTVTDTCCNG